MRSLSRLAAPAEPAQLSKVPVAQPVPMTDRILARLPGRRRVWIPIWASITAGGPFLVLALDGWVEGTGLTRQMFWEVLPYRVVFTYMVIVALTATHSLAKAAYNKEQRTRPLLPPGERDGRRVLSVGLDSTRGPLLATAGATVVSAIEEAYMHSAPSLVLALPLAFVINLPIMTHFWTFLAIMVGFHRLGAKPLLLDRYPQDPSLGLSPVGHLGFQSTWMFLALVVPFLVLAVHNPLELVFGLALTLAPIILLLMSFIRLHDQMIDVRLDRVAWARTLYEDAFDPVRDASDSSRLKIHAESLRTAEMLVRRAEDIWEWPLSARLMGAVVGITAGVVTSLSARALLSFLGW